MTVGSNAVGSSIVQEAVWQYAVDSNSMQKTVVITQFCLLITTYCLLWLLPDSAY